MKEYIGTIGIDLGFGYTLSRIGFSPWDEVHKMFTFADLRLLYTLALATAVLVVAWQVIRSFSHPKWQARRIHPGSLVGGLLFGAGRALCGSCPSIAPVQLGEAQLGALLSLCGIFLGNWLYSVMHERYFRWPTTSCIDD